MVPMHIEPNDPDAPSDHPPLHVDKDENIATLQKLDPRSIALEQLSSWIVFAILLAGLVVLLIVVWSFASWPNSLRIPITFISMMGLGAMGYRAHQYPKLWYERAGFILGKNTLEIQTGVWWRAVTTIPRSRVQHTDVVQGPLMRRFGVAKLVIHTAGTLHAKVELVGLSREQAQTTRDHLIARIDGQKPGSPDGV